MSETRAQIQECVYRNPGVHFNEISRKLDIATGQTQYHLRKLIRGERLERESIAGRTHYYPPTYSEWERGAIALLRRETTREIVLYLLRNDRATPAELTDRLDLARSTIEWHLSRLIDREIVTKERLDDSANELVIQLVDESDVYRLLREIEPRLLDRVVDRFSRLADDLLDG